MSHDFTPPPVAVPLDPPEVTLSESVSSTAADLSDLAGKLPGHDPASLARQLDRLAEELAEAAAMARALPGRPDPMSGHGYAALAAFRSAIGSGEDISEFAAATLARLDAEGTS
jgi:hypothetical protein